MSKHFDMPQNVVIQNWITERTTTIQSEEGRYAFKVDARANKYEIRDAVEKLFKVKVDSVNVMSVRGKIRRVRYRPGFTPSWKKALIKLKPGFTIEL